MEAIDHTNFAFHTRMANLTENQKKMHAEFPAFFEKCMMICCTYNKTRPMKVRKEGNASQGTYVTGPVVSATPHHYRYAAKSVSMVFEAEIETTHPITKEKFLHTVYIRRLPK